ncbi:MAG TPA: hypothetical protein EYP88_07600 [Anaerolineales bacterium]|nr:hypothetical protein [Anaerolineales bacterium]
MKRNVSTTLASLAMFDAMALFLRLGRDDMQTVEFRTQEGALVVFAALFRGGFVCAVRMRAS